MKLRIAQVKFVPEKGNLEANHDRLFEILPAIAKEKPDVVVTCECFLDGYVVTEPYTSRENVHKYAIDPEKSPYAEAVSKWARENNSWFIFGCLRLTPEGVANSALIYNRKGELVGIYDKIQTPSPNPIHIFGDRLPVFDSEFGPFGVLICADRRWPETVRSLAIRGARIIFNPTYGMHDSMNFCMVRTRSFESEVAFVFTHPKQALITAPKRLIYCNDEEDSHLFVVTEVDLSVVDEARANKQKCHIINRRPEVYGL